MCEDVSELYEFCRHRGKSYVNACRNALDCDMLDTVDLIIMSFCPRCFGSLRMPAEMDGAASRYDGKARTKPKVVEEECSGGNSDKT
ncbi:hypothetical protein AJ80_03381 [Polytolypa hystricis UAMH7299]|uniref:Uncharacterized protein n=1 Tax=Polytolypa hystricis (strain UAMH7299) TaxID=1447883 RepID=A0A2B7YJH3_POLH7|nr:hypothetical protein AJ80_03381 [Polytolypa hystricis UAMH7299]